jgi:HSP20 family protein
MLRMNDLANSLSHTWESVSHGWNNLINNAGQALTHFGVGGDKENEANIPAQSPRWGLMSADVFDDTNKLVIKLEVPGLDGDDFDISVIDNVLSISGEKRFQREETKGDYRLLECAYGQFSRSIPLGYEVDADSAKAVYDKGILKVELEKKPHQKRRQIPVN